MDHRSIPISHAHSHSIKNIFYAHTNLLFSLFSQRLSRSHSILVFHQISVHWSIDILSRSSSTNNTSKQVSKHIGRKNDNRNVAVKNHQCHFKDRTKQLVELLPFWKFSSPGTQLFTSAHRVRLAHKKNGPRSATSSVAFRLQQNVTIDCMAVHEVKQHHNKNSIVNY